MQTEYFIKVALVMAAMYITYKIFMSREKYYAINRATILSSVAVSFVIPLIKLPFLDKEVYVEAETFAPEIDLEPVAMAIEPEPQISFTEIIPYILAVGIALFFLKYIVTTLSIIGKVAFSHKITLREGVKLIISETIKSPVSWLRYIFMNSHDYQENSREVLTHEMAHITHRHSIDLIFMDLACCLQWFNPAIWLFKRELRAVHEYQADHEVIASGFNAKQYQTLLIKKAAGRKWSSVASSLNHSNLKKRITMMSSKKSSQLAVIKVLLPIAVSALLTAKFAESNAQTIVVTSSKDNHLNLNIQTAPQDPIVIVDGKTSNTSAVESSKIKSISVYKGTSATDKYGDDAQNGVIEITTKNVDPSEIPGDEGNTAPDIPSEQIIITPTTIDKDNDVKMWAIPTLPSTPLVIIDGKEGTIDDVDASQIKSILVLKDQEAIDKYGEKGANGVIIVTTKKSKKENANPVKIRVTTPQNNEDSVYVTPDVMPQFPGGDKALFNFINENIQYPEEAKAKGISGTAYYRFMVNKQGKVTNITLLRSAGDESLDQEAKRVIEMLPDFKPGIKDNKPVDVPMSMPIRFSNKK
ncbi:MAG: TonB family protein [Bacteroidales bacterium]|nr:TonB family protein [Bacteroidales bacterium]